MFPEEEAVDKLVGRKKAALADFFAALEDAFELLLLLLLVVVVVVVHPLLEDRF